MLILSVHDPFHNFLRCITQPCCRSGAQRFEFRLGFGVDPLGVGVDTRIGFLFHVLQGFLRLSLGGLHGLAAAFFRGGSERSGLLGGLGVAAICCGLRLLHGGDCFHCHPNTS